MSVPVVSLKIVTVLLGASVANYLASGAGKSAQMQSAGGDYIYAYLIYKKKSGKSQ